MTEITTITCKSCRKQFKVAKAGLDYRFSLLCDYCLIDDQNAKHGNYRPDPEEAEFIFRENERTWLEELERGIERR